MFGNRKKKIIDELKEVKYVIDSQEVKSISNRVNKVNMLENVIRNRDKKYNTDMAKLKAEVLDLRTKVRQAESFYNKYKELGKLLEKGNN
jgi:two-component SAPR family response regulator